MARGTPLQQRNLRQLTPKQLLTERTRLERVCAIEKKQARSTAIQAALEGGMSPYHPELDRIAAEAWQRPAKSQSKLDAVRNEIKRRLAAGDPLVDRMAVSLANRAHEELFTSSGAPQPVGVPSVRLNYRSHLKRAIAHALLKNPNATDHQVCRSLDEDGGVPLPRRWKQQQTDWSFVQAYRDPQTRNRVEVAISAVRKDLRKAGLVPKT